LSDALGRESAIFTVEEFLAWFAAASARFTPPPAVAVGRRATRRAVMDLNADGGPTGSPGGST
jgi:hypothetical protein